MPSQVVIVHGWSDTSKSFDDLAGFLKKSGHVAVPLWLGDYISLEDDVRVPDVAKRMHAVLNAKLATKELTTPFDMIVHSTGSLVAREWLTTYYDGVPESAPVKRLIMLAPANYGSKLASMGQSMLGRLVKGWKNWFHTGKEMLQALELGSPYLWELVERDIFVPLGASKASSIYSESAVWPFVITGTHPYPSKLRQIINEDGADGTVRVAAANLNARGLTLDFTKSNEEPVATPWDNRYPNLFPLAVLRTRTHGSIIKPEDGDIDEETPEQRKLLGDLILEALNCKTHTEYQGITAKWHGIAEAAVGTADDRFHQYMQVNVFVVDDYGTPVDDYFLEFSGPDGDKSDDAIVYFHRNVLEHVHTNGEGGARRCLYVDRTDLVDNFYGKIKTRDKVLMMSLSVNPPGDNVRYFADLKTGAKGSYKLHGEDAKQERWLRRNTTHFLKIVIPRYPVSKVFEIRS